jgi:tetratricopeptide (TPR) repeat protein
MFQRRRIPLAGRRISQPKAFRAWQFAGRPFGFTSRVPPSREPSTAERLPTVDLQGTAIDGVASSMVSSQAPEARLIGPYHLLEPIGQGGMGVIWRAQDTRLGRTVAVKLLRAGVALDQRAKARFLQEAQIASVLDHPNICSIYEAGETADQQLYFVMPCYEGETLGQRIERGAQPLSEVLGLALQIAEGLGRAHQKGIVHRDIKPSNLMITSEGVLKILDFGIAKLGGRGLTRAGAIVGTLAYMSPEQIQGQDLDPRTDLWSLGVVIYEMVTGRHPFSGQSDCVVAEAILRAEPEPMARLRPEVPPELDRLVRSLLKKERKDRTASAANVAASLYELAGGSSRPDRKVWPFSGFQSLAALAALLALIAVAAAIGFTRGSRGSALTPRKADVTASAALDRRQAISVLGFQNLSTDKSQQWLGQALTEMVGAELAAGGKIRVVPSDRTAFARKSLGLGVKESLDSTNMERLHTLIGADLGVIGTYLPLGTPGEQNIRLDIRVLSMPAGDTVAVVVVTAAEKDLFRLVTEAGSRLREALGLSLPTQQERLQARGLVPAGADTIRLYTEALSRLRSFDPTVARDLLLHAEAIEPRSVAIQSALSEAWTMLGQDNRAREAARRAFEDRRALPEEAQLAIEARFYEAGAQWDRASQAYRSLAALVPDELEHGLKLANTLSMAGRGPEALAILAKLQARPAPERDDPRIDLMEAGVSWRLSDLTRMEKAARAAVAKGRRLGAWLIIARGLVFQAHCVEVKGRPLEAVALLREAEELALRAGDRSTAARAAVNMGLALQQQGDLAGAEQVQERALIQAREFGSAVGVAAQMYVLGDLDRIRGDFNHARSRLEEARVWYHRLDYRVWDAQTEVALASVELAQGEPAIARRLLTESLETSRAVSRVAGEVDALQGLIELAAATGAWEDAFRLQDQALRIVLTLHRPGLSALVLASSADLLARTGNLPLANRHLLLAEAAGRRAADQLTNARLLGARARFALRAGDLPAARAASEEELRLARGMRARPLEASALRDLVRIARAAGDVGQARGFLLEALRISAETGDSFAHSAGCLDLARLELDAGRLESALKLARDAAEWNHSRGFTDESLALAWMAEALLRMGRLTEAREAIQKAVSRAPAADRELRLLILPTQTRVTAGLGGPQPG